MVGKDAVAEDILMLGVQQEGKGIALPFHDALFQRRIGFSPGQGLGAHAEGLGHFHFNGGGGDTYLDASQILDGTDGFLDAHKIAVTVFAIHDRLQPDRVEFLAEKAA